ncbi:hypothetical protein BMF94_3793 [Rhodotorula taiwanensis]|uniref:Actin-related protein 5 n=1 Tax=Rhodotorula taiwanensis TaxID=741276 RepID=A0A2S5B8Q8_9BASI|nr:hypothetical protein BMF94_3793 [Rhodotorula taiwanensis]
MAVPAAVERDRSVYPIPELQPVVAAPPAATDYSQFANADTVLCLDNGATTLRAGWSREQDPRFAIDNLVSKYRDRKSNRSVLLAGSEVYVDATSRAHVRAPHEADVVTSPDVMENILDYVLLKLGVDSDGLQNPVALTETLCNPVYSRSLMSEILFEGYSAPSVSYSVDSLMSLYANSPNPASADALIISSSTASTHVIPVLNGQAVMTNAKKLNWGGSQAAEYLLKLMQLKYPAFPGRLSSYQSGVMYRDHSYHAVPSYASHLARLASSPQVIVAEDRTIQFPFVAGMGAQEKTAADLEAQQKRREEATKRLKEQAARQRQEKLERQQEELVAFTELHEARGTVSKLEYDQKLRAAGFSSLPDLEDYLKKLEKSLTRARNRELGIDESENKEGLRIIQEPPSFPLIDVPDHQLNEEDLKEKRKQKLMKAGYDARIRLKAEKDQERRRVEEERRRDEELRLNDFPKWLQGLREQHEDILEKIKERKKLKEQLSDRKSLAAQNRMKSIAGLAADEKAGRKRKRTEQDDGFGQNDADWAVYKEIGTGDDSEDEEDEQEALKKVESRLLEHDPKFTLDDTAERRAMRKHQLLNAFIRGLAPDDPLDTYDPESPEHNSQLHVNIERTRVPEVIWQPHMAGLDQAGLTEIIEHVLKGFTESERQRLTQNVFVTGGNTLVPNFDARLRSSLQPSLPVGQALNIVRSYDVQNDAWRGLAKWSTTAEGQQARITRADYDERGKDWYAGHAWGNW